MFQLSKNTWFIPKIQVKLACQSPPSENLYSQIAGWGRQPTHQYPFLLCTSRDSDPSTHSACGLVGATVPLGGASVNNDPHPQVPHTPSSPSLESTGSSRHFSLSWESQLWTSKSDQQSRTMLELHARTTKAPSRRFNLLSFQQTLTSQAFY